MISDFLPGDLVKSDRPAGPDAVPHDERHRIGLILGRVPRETEGSPYRCASLLVAWFGPQSRPSSISVAFELDHRVTHV